MAYENGAPATEDSVKPVAGGVQYVEAGEGDAGQRLDNFVVRVLKGVPRTHVYRLLRKGGRVANAMRVLLRVAAAREGKQASLDVVEPR